MSTKFKITLTTKCHETSHQINQSGAGTLFNLLFLRAYGVLGDV